MGKFITWAIGTLRNGTERNETERGAPCGGNKKISFKF